MTWLGSLYDWVRRRPRISVAPHIQTLRELERDIVLEEAEERTAQITARALALRTSENAEGVRKELSVAQGAAARRARLQAEADVLRRRYAIPE